MDSHAFIDYCQQQLNENFERTYQGKPDDKLKYRTEGLLQAARLLEIMTDSQIKDMIETQHMAVFGESVEDRRSRKRSLAELKLNDPDAFYEIPPIQRR